MPMTYGGGGYFVSFEIIMRPRSSTDASLPLKFCGIVPGQLMGGKSLLLFADVPPVGKAGFTAHESSAI